MFQTFTVIKRGLLVLLAGMFMGIAVAQSEVKLGKDYEVLSKNIAANNSNKISVIEFFSYGCPHCSHFEPELQAWAKRNSSKIDFSRSPVIFPGSRWGEPYFAEIYYTLEAMGKIGALHDAVFEAVQKKGLNFADKKVLADWLQSQKISPAEFDKVRESFGVKSQMRAAETRMNDAQVESTPQVIVGGKYRVISAGSFKRILEVADTMIVREQFEAKKKK